MKKVLRSVVLGLLLVGALAGCSLFQDATEPLAVEVYVNGVAWNSAEILARPSYTAGAVVVKVVVSGGDPASPFYEALYRDGTAARSAAFESELILGIKNDTRITIRDGRAEPVVLQVEVENHTPVVRMPFTVAECEWRAHLQLDLVGREHGCDSAAGQPTQLNGIQDEDLEYGDEVEYKIRISGPLGSGRSGDYAIYEKLGVGQYRLLNDEWVALDVPAHVIIGWDGTLPNYPFGLAFTDPLACDSTCPEPHPPPAPVPTGETVTIEVWARDMLGSVGYGVFHWTLYESGCW